MKLRGGGGAYWVGWGRGRRRRRCRTCDRAGGTQQGPAEYAAATRSLARARPACSPGRPPAPPHSPPCVDVRGVVLVVCYAADGHERRQHQRHQHQRRLEEQQLHAASNDRQATRASGGKRGSVRPVWVKGRRRAGVGGWGRRGGGEGRASGRAAAPRLLRRQIRSPAPVHMPMLEPACRAQWPHMALLTTGKPAWGRQGRAEASLAQPNEQHAPPVPPVPVHTAAAPPPKPLRSRKHARTHIGLSHQRGAGNRAQQERNRIHAGTPHAEPHPPPAPHPPHPTPASPNRTCVGCDMRRSLPTKYQVRTDMDANM